MATSVTALVAVLKLKTVPGRRAAIPTSAPPREHRIPGLSPDARAQREAS